MKLYRYKGCILFCILFFCLYIFGGYTVSANEVLPSISRVFAEHEPLIEGETQSYFVTCNYSGNVQYALKIDKVTIANKKTVLTPVFTQNYGEITDGNTMYKLDGTNKFEPGNYRIYIYVKRAGVEGKLKNKDFSFDNMYSLNLICKSKNEKRLILLSGKPVVNRGDFRVGELIKTDENDIFIQGDIEADYNLNIFDVGKSSWLRNTAKSGNSLGWTPDKQGQYILNISASSKDKKVAAYKNKLIDICDNFKVESINYIDPTTIQVNFTMEPDVSDVQNKNNYYISTSEINTISMLGSKSVILKLKTPIAKNTLYFVNSIKFKDNPLIVTSPYTEIEKRIDNDPPFVKNIENNKNTIKVLFSEPLKTIGTALIVQGDITLDVSNKFVPGTDELKFEMKEFSPDEPISLIIKDARDMFENTMDINPYITDLKMIKTDFAKPMVSNIKVLSPDKVEISFNERLKYPPIIMVGNNTVTFDEYSSADNITFVGSCGYFLGKHTVKVVAYQDLSGNFGDKVERELDFREDKNPPRLLNYEKKIFNNKVYLVLNFDEQVRPIGYFTNITGTREFKTMINKISFTFATNVNAVSYLKENGADKNNLKAVMIDISNTDFFPAGAYKVKIDKGLVSDFSNNLSQELSNISFDCDGYYNDGKELSIIGKPKVSDDYAYIDVEFSKNVKETTALDVSNYKINGKCIIKHAEKRTGNIVRLIIASDHIDYTGERTLEISGITDDAGNKIEKYQSIIYLGENKKPYMDYAVLKDKNTIGVVFSENVSSVGSGDFEVYIDGIKVDNKKITVSNYRYLTKEVEIKVDSSITLVNNTKTIQVKLKGSGITDTSGNKAVKDVYIKVLK